MTSGRIHNMHRISRSLSWFCVILACHASGVFAAPDDFGQTNRAEYEQNAQRPEHQLRLAKKNPDEVGALPLDALQGIYAECILGWSLPCIQKKLIAFLYKLDNMKSIYLIGKSVLIVRKKNASSDTTTLARVADHVDQAYLKDIIDNLIEKFFDNHALRLRVPEYLEDPGDLGGDDGDGTYLDIDFGAKHSTRESRGKKKYKKVKGLKKLMMMVGLMTCIKLTMMGPLMIGLLGLKAMKALILAVVALTINKMAMLSKIDVHSLFSGHDWYTSATGYGSSWDRNILEPPTSTPALPYNIEPPGIYNSYTIKSR